MDRKELENLFTMFTEFASDWEQRPRSMEAWMTLLPSKITWAFAREFTIKHFKQTDKHPKPHEFTVAWNEYWSNALRTGDLRRVCDDSKHDRKWNAQTQTNEPIGVWHSHEDADGNVTASKCPYVMPFQKERT
jgi:hypothetical protein